MTQASDIRTQFNAGELSPLLEGRVDFAKYGNGCRTLENFIPTVQGAAKRRQGSRYVATTKDPGERVWLRPFQASNQEQYVLEFGANYIRFYTDHGQLESAPNIPYEVSTAYTSADLTSDEDTCTLQMVQSNDVLYITHGSYPPATLSRTGVGAFAFTEAAIGVSKDGPFKDLNADETITISASADTGSITLNASTGIFLDGMVGKYFYLQEGNNILVSQWEYNKAILVGDRRRSDSINYIATTAATTGNVKPVHLEGTRFDGDTGVQWEFTDDGSGVVYIDSLVGAQPTGTVLATVIKRLPYSITAGPGGSTHRWAAAAWTDDDGYPDATCFFRERLCFARDQTVWMSVAGDFPNFATTTGGLTLADNAIVLTLAADKKDRIEWMKAEAQLLVGTASGEYAIAEYSNGQPLGPANVRAQRQSVFGSRDITPITAGAATLFIERGGRRVREMAFDIRQNQYQSVDVTVLGEHITKTLGITPSARINDFEGIVDWTYAVRPDHVLWCARADGQLLGFTYNREQDVTAWHRHKIGYQLDGGLGWGQVESVCAIASPDGTQEDVWLCVKRGDARHIEYIGQPEYTNIANTPWSAAPLALTPQQLLSAALWEVDAFYVDGGLSRTPSIAYITPVSTQIFLTSGSAWTVPADWNDAANTIECIGGGAGGRSRATLASGGGGGAYSKRTGVALTPGASVAFSVGAGGAAGVNGGDTFFGAATYAASTVAAKGGSTSTTQAGGSGGFASAGLGAVRWDGGPGGSSVSASDNGGGGGGAGGPSGPGGAAGNGGIGASVGGGGGPPNGSIIAGESGDNSGAGGIPCGGDGGSSANGAAGTGDACFDATHGCGGGGGGAGTTHTGGAGGAYGGGGGGGDTAGAGAAGLIVITYTPIPLGTASSVSGLDHLEGLTVQVVADGSPHPDCVVVGGAITLNGSYYTAHVGCKAPAILETMQINVGSQDGTAQGKIKRITHVTMRMLETKGGWIGPDADHLEELRYRTARMLMDTYVPFFSGDLKVLWPGGFEEQSRIYVLQDSGFPMTVCALMPQLKTNDVPV